MFTDMVGYSALAQKDEALSLALLEEHHALLRPIFSRFGGVEIDTAGDSFFIEFESAVNAVECAIEIQKLLFERNHQLSADRQINVRIGIHLGDVVHMGSKVHGDGVNIAARLEPLAEPGGICLSGDVVRQITNKVRLNFQKMERPVLKNISIPMDVYSVVLPWRRSFAGIDKELARVVLKRKWKPAAMIVLLLLLTGVIVDRIVIPFFEEAERATIAVLPFRSLHESDEYFTVGLTEDVITRVSRIENLQVTSMTSVLRFRNTDRTARDIGKELGVANILVGSVRREEDRLRISVELIDVETDRNLWTNQYDLELTRLLEVQEDVSKKIAHALETRISPERLKEFTRSSTLNPDAYDLYLKGRHHWNKRQPEDLKKSIEYFQKALELDPRYARVYAALADAYIIMGDFNVLQPVEAYRRAKDAANRALELDDRMADAHCSLAYALMHHDWNWAEAEKEFRTAISLDSLNAQAHSWYALLLAARGRFDEAQKEAQKALRLEPFSAVIYTDMGLVSFAMQKYEQAIEYCEKALKQDKTFFAAYILQGLCYEQLRNYGEARTVFYLVYGHSDKHPVTVAALAHTYAKTGDRTRALAMIDTLLSSAQGINQPAYWIAAVYTAVGKFDQAFSWLDKSLASRDGLIIYLNVDARFEQLHEDNRFKILLDRMAEK